MLTLAFLAVAVVSTSAIPTVSHFLADAAATPPVFRSSQTFLLSQPEHTPELQQNAYDAYDEFQPTKQEELKSGGIEYTAQLGLADELPERFNRPEAISVTANRIDRLGGNHLIQSSYADSGDGMNTWKRRIDTLGGNNLVRRSVDKLGGNYLVKRFDGLSSNSLSKKALDHLGGNYLVRRAFDSLGNNGLAKGPLKTSSGNNPEKRPSDTLGGNSLAKRILDPLGGNSLVKRLMVELKGSSNVMDGNILARRPMGSVNVASLNKRRVDTLGGNRLVKRLLDTLGGNRLVKRPLDTLGGNRLVRRGVGELEDQRLSKRSREGNSTPNFVDRLGGGHLLKRSPEYSEVVEEYNRPADDTERALFEAMDSYVNAGEGKEFKGPFLRLWEYSSNTPSIEPFNAVQLNSNREE